MNPENLLGEWARLLVESLADAGLRDVVVSPGSRSTPLVWALLACERLHCTSIIDERDAGFYAVGHAKITGKPVALVCTSGSAAANYFPAIVEAVLSHTPLLVLTADRPFELQDCGASQTIDQVRLFGSYARFVELGMPEAHAAALAAVRRRAAQALFETVHPVPGVVHWNVRARKPLEPAPAKSAAAMDLTARVDALLRAPPTAIPKPRILPNDDALVSLLRDLSSSERGLIVCGPRARGSLGSALGRLAVAARLPVYAEATSQLRFDAPPLPRELMVDALDLLARAGHLRGPAAPDFVLRIGSAPVSSALERALSAHPAPSVHIVTDHGFPDPESRARSLLVGDLEETLSRIANAVESHDVPAARRNWASRIAHANAIALRALSGFSESAGFPTEGMAVRTVVSALPEGAVFALGNSLPVRHADAFCEARSGTGISVWSQRGAAGIDGVIAGAAGAADAAGKPTALVLGDVSALHDIGGFAVAAKVRAPLVIVILNNDGGRIFEQLPLRDAGLPEPKLAFWTTPHGRSFEAVARLWDLPYTAPKTPTELRSALGAGLTDPGAKIVELRCPPHGAEQEYDALVERVKAELERAGRLDP